MDRGVRVDLREQVREIPHQTSITKDNAPISIDFLWYSKVVTAADSVLQVGSFEAAAQGMATTTLRSVIGGLLLDDVLSQREHINQMLRTKLDEVTERWGVKVTNVEIREIIPPRDVQDAMNRQMTAERVRRAVVTESTGTREAAINVAEGDKQANILKAEGQKQASILVAEGEREAQLLRAEGYSAALERIYGIAQTVDNNTMTIQYFETLKRMAEGASTKWIFPLSSPDCWKVSRTESRLSHSVAGPVIVGARTLSEVEGRAPYGFFKRAGRCVRIARRSEGRGAPVSRLPRGPCLDVGP
jgi:regulator of protease activity HflC (stomatin/prohibitin superfamily)